MLMAGSERVQPLMFETLSRAVLMNPAAAQREALQVSGVLEASVNVCSRTFQTGLVGRGGEHQSWGVEVCVRVCVALGRQFEDETAEKRSWKTDGGGFCCPAQGQEGVAGPSLLFPWRFSFKL